MTLGPIRRHIAAVSAATFTAGSLLAVAVGGLTSPAGARQFEALVVTPDQPVLVTFDPTPGELPYIRKADPGQCRTADYCDTIPLEIPEPDISATSDYKLRFKITNLGSNDIDAVLWDNGQIKEQFGKAEPGDTNYDPLESDYTDLRVMADPNKAGPNKDGFVELGRPDLVDYNFTVLNFSGTSKGYTIFAEILIEESVQPREILPPESRVAVTPTSVAAAPATTIATAPTVELDPFAEQTPGLDSVRIERDPDLAAIREQNLADQLAGPPAPIVARRASVAGPAAPVSGLTAFLWLAVLPAAVAGSATGLVLRRRVRLPDIG
ncbi:MAG TPA: hypothetical protein VGA13_03845 [Acidimicrobiales bacterium]